MNPEYFGLKRPPFRSNTVGADVFVGPQTAVVMGAVKKALAVEDAVIAVTGPVGVGKTTVVRRAVDAIGDNRIVITIGRLQLGYDEVIELLLAGLGARQLPKSTVQRFAVFRRLLHQYAAQGTRVFIVVEDAKSLGIAALAELEALTAEDAGASSGASLVLMGAAGLPDLLRDPQLARLKQRVRLRQLLQPLGESELRAYLKHAFRLAGRDFEDIFESGAAATLYKFSGGIPRVCNGIIDQVMTTAAEEKLSKIPVSLIERTAAEEIGLTTEHSVADIKQALVQAEVEKTEAATDASADLSAEAKQDTIEVVAGSTVDAPPSETKSDAAAKPVEPPSAPAAETRPPEPIAAPEPVMPVEPAAEPVAAGADDDDDDIPDLIQDTLPDLEVLAPELAAAGPEEYPVPEPEKSLQPESEPQLADLTIPEAVIPKLPIPEVPAQEAAEAEAEIPELPVTPPEPEARAAAEPEPPVLTDADAAAAAPEPAEVPEWERDPTFAELRPDLDALERAMSIAHGSDEDKPPVAEEVEAPAPEPAAPVPEITLDREIQAKIDEATEALRATETDIPTLEEMEEEDQSAEAATGNSEMVEPLTEPATEAAADASKRRPDKEELGKLAAQLSKARSIEDVDDKLAETLFGEEFSMIAAEVAAAASANDDIELSLEAEETNEATGTDGDAVADGVTADSSPSQRLATVRALNNGNAPDGAPPVPGPAESIVMSAAPATHHTPPASGPQPDSIEEQMETSMTATLKALNANAFEEDHEEEEKRGFFSRFRRS